MATPRRHFGPARGLIHLRLSTGLPLSSEVLTRNGLGPVEEQIRPDRSQAFWEDVIPPLYLDKETKASI